MTILVFVYALTTAADGYRPRYVGQTRDRDRRLSEHLRSSGGQRRASAVKAWSAERRAAGHEVLLLTLQAGAALREAEVFWVAALRRLGHDLLNETDGGDGGRYNWER